MPGLITFHEFADFCRKLPARALHNFDGAGRTVRTGHAEKIVEHGCRMLDCAQMEGQGRYQGDVEQLYRRCQKQGTELEGLCVCMCVCHLDLLRAQVCLHILWQAALLPPQLLDPVHALLPAQQVVDDQEAHAAHGAGVGHCNKSGLYQEDL